MPEETIALWRDPIGPRAGSCGSAAYKREPVFATNIAEDLIGPITLSWQKFGFGACCSTPVFSSDGALLGTVACISSAPRT